jgi:predicted nucleic acid-binding protein
LSEFQWIQVVEVSTSELSDAGAELIGNRRGSELYRWFSRQVDRPEVEAIVLAKRTSACALVEDNNGTKCASDFAVPVWNVADLLEEFERRRYISDAKSCAETILATGYYSKELRWLSWRRDRPTSN